MLSDILLHIASTCKHKFYVTYYLTLFCLELIKRGIFHDLSKLYPDEILGFSTVIKELSTSEFGSKEYKDNARKISPTIRLHKSRNPHHPEYYPNGILDFNLVDLVEQWTDWQASNKRNLDGDILKSIDICKERYKLGEILTSILTNEATRSRSK